MTLRAPTAAESALLEDYAVNGVDLPGVDQPWLAERRASALALFKQAGLPHRRIESWKYTDLRARLSALEPATPWRGAVDLSGDLADPFAAVECDRLVFVNGAFRADLSQLPKGIEVTSLAAARPEWSKSALGQTGDHAIAALNLALARDGALIRVAAGNASERPLHLLFLDPAREGVARATHVRNVLVLEACAKLTLLETHLGQGGAGDLANIVTEIKLGEGATLDHVKLVAESESSQHVATIFAELASSARYEPFILTANGGLARSELIATLAGRTAHFGLSAASVIGGREHADITTLVDHAAPSATSRQTVKSVIGGHGRGIYQGKIIVREGANGTDSHQLAKSVLLSPTAEAHTKPELEIYADDVKCGHGATAGALDENALFYLRSRGIDLWEAKSLLLQAFIEDAVTAIANPQVREAVRARALTKLQQLGAAA